MIWEVFGWLGTATLAACTIPQAIHTWKVGNTRGMSPTFIILWVVGGTFSLLYLLGLHPDAIPLIVARLLNYVSLGVMLYFMLWPRKSSP